MIMKLQIYCLKDLWLCKRPEYFSCTVSVACFATKVNIKVGTFYFKCKKKCKKILMLYQKISFSFQPYALSYTNQL
jgi:hypothetical protein